MKKLLLNVAFILFSVTISYLQGQTMDNKGGAMAVHEARFKVCNYDSKEPIPSAGIYDKAGAKLGSTDTKGILVLALPSSSADSYTIKADGFNPVSIRLTYASKTSADYDVFLPKSEGGNTVKDENAPANTLQTASTSQDKVKVYVKQDPSTYKKSTNSASQGVEFAVQLSATSRPITDKSSLKSWEELGPVYIHTENGLYKVRIGPYDTQENAAKVLLQAKERGKKDAFIVVQKGIENHVPYDLSKHQPTEFEDKPKEVVVTTEPETTGDAGMMVEYKVRLASYLKPGGFNTKDVDQYGPLESYRKGEWTIMLIGGFKTEKEAQRVKEAVMAKGFTDASVVVERDGILELNN